MDLTNEDEKQAIMKYANQYRDIGYEVLITSSETEAGIDGLNQHIENKISVFAGQSGVGKVFIAECITTRP